MSYDVTGALARHAARVRFEDLSPSAIAKAKTFLLDTIGVGVAGSSGTGVAQVLDLARSWGPGEEATSWVGGLTRIDSSSAIQIPLFRNEASKRSITRPHRQRKAPSVNPLS